MEQQEWLPEVDDLGNVIGELTREEAHSGSFKLHPVVHLHVFNSKGELYLQKRAMHKKIQPGKWDTAVGGHVDYGETIEQALIRETAEELGFALENPQFLERYVFTSAVESELVYVYCVAYNGPIFPDPGEISEGRFWSLNEIEQQLNRSVLTPNFAQEYVREISNFLSFIGSGK